MKCRGCGCELEAGAHFCGACGTRVDWGADANPDSDSAPTRSLDVPPSAAHAAPAPAPSHAAPPPSRAPAPASASASARTPSPMASPGGPSTAAKVKQDARAALAAAVTMPRPRNDAALDATMLAPGGRSLGGARGESPHPAVLSSSGGAREATARAERKTENTGSRDHLVGRTLNKRYLVGEKVGEGGFGAVFRGKQLATGREVALKILHPYNLGDKTIVARFRREAEACSRLRNPHTVITYDFDETDDGVLYLAMEMLRGRSLHHVEKSEGHMDPDRVLRVIDQVAEALGEAHQNGIVHRDMKPENVFIERRGDEDYVKVLDFGIAKMITDDRGQAALTAVGQTLGTLEFMSPEQLRGQPLDGRSDIYALGIMAYEMLTGELPFKDAKTPVQIINFHMQRPAPPPSRLKPGLQIPSYVDEVILKMVGKSREDRYPDTAALRAHIARVLKGADKRADRFEAYRVVGVVGAALLIISALVYFLSR